LIAREGVGWEGLIGGVQTKCYCFRIIVPLNEASTATVGPSKVPKYHHDTLELSIMALIRENPSITQRELSEQLVVSLPTIKRAMAPMVEKQVLERKGGKRFGYWEIQGGK
jgi:ATP-dependent DNA helicase RecG